MSFENRVSYMLSKYGDDVTLTTLDGKSYNIKAFIQPLLYKNKMYLDTEGTENGIRDEKIFSFIGPPSPDISTSFEGVRVKMNNRGYFVVSASVITIKNQPQYTWGILRAVTKDGDYERIG